MDQINETIKKRKDVFNDITDKIKRLTNALYRVTDLLSDMEPIKWTLRNKAVVLYDNLVSFDSLKDKNRVVCEVMDSFDQISNVLDLCSRGSFISNVNFEILKREYLNLKSFMEGNKKDIVLEQSLLLESNTEEADSLKIGQPESAVQSKNLGTKIKKTEKAFGGSSLNSNLFVDSQKVSNGTDRKQKILDFLKKEGPKTISDIAVVFSGEKISSKTIQRDLTVLINEGKITARGEKRWRTYSIKT